MCIDICDNALITDTVTGCAYNTVVPNDYAQCVKPVAGVDKIFVDGNTSADQCIDKCVVKLNDKIGADCGFVEGSKGVVCTQNKYYIEENICLPACVAGEITSSCAYNKDNAGVWTVC